MSEAVIALIKLMLSRPTAVDEISSLMMKNPAALTTRGVTMKDVKKAVTIISESDYWQNHILKNGCGSKARRFLFTVIDENSDDAPSEESELEIGFSEDDQPQQPRQPSPRKPNKKKLTKRTKTVDTPPSDESEPSPKPKRRRLLKKKRRDVTSSPSSDQDGGAASSASSSRAFATPTMDISDPEEPPSSGKKQQPRRPPSSSAYSFVGGMKENVRPESAPSSRPQSPAKSKPKPRPEAASSRMRPPIFTVPPAPPAAATASEPVHVVDWSSEFGQVVKQALTWRVDRMPCPFRALGLVSSTTNLAEVKKRWSKLILLLHPDKAPKEWRGVKELSDAAQAVNEARAECERRLTASAVSRPNRPEQGQFAVAENNGSRVVEIRWQPPSQGASLVEKYTVLLRYPSVVTLASVNAGADPWLALSEVDPRYRQFFQAGDRFLFHVHASNAAGMSEALVIDVPLRSGATVSVRAPSTQGTADGGDQVERMFEGLRQIAKNEGELFSALHRFSIDQLKNLLRCQSAARLSAPAPPPSGLGNKATLIERLMGLLRSK